MLYTMWLDAMKLVATNSHGNILSFDGSMEGFDRQDDAANEPVKQWSLVTQLLSEALSEGVHPADMIVWVADEQDGIWW